MVILKSQGRDLISVPGKSGVECLNNTVIAEIFNENDYDDLYIKITRNLYIKISINYIKNSCIMIITH